MIERSGPIPQNNWDVRADRELPMKDRDCAEMLKPVGCVYFDVKKP